MDYQKATEIIEEAMVDYKKEDGVGLDFQSAFGLLGYVSRKARESSEIPGLEGVPTEGPEAVSE